jgi:hypothetical protein
MEYRGKTYSVVQALEGCWKWSIEIDGRTRSGVANGTRQSVIRLVEREIDRVLAPKRVKLNTPG